ncbi:MAG: hypothetical protein WBE97_00800, partial [Candidatus Acidiferrales bacterium]
VPGLALYGIWEVVVAAPGVGRSAGDVLAFFAHILPGSDKPVALTDETLKDSHVQKIHDLNI